MFLLEADTIVSAGSGRSYRPSRTLGHGAFGEVLLAVDESSGQQVAIKQLWLRGDGGGPLPLPIAREVAALQCLRHANIVALTDVALAGPCLYLVTELCSTDLAALLAGASTPVPLHVASSIARQLFAALAAVHAAGFMHRDVKPANILIDAGAGCIKLADFGLARRQASGGPVVGPQQAQRGPRLPEPIQAELEARLAAAEQPGQQQQQQQQQQPRAHPRLRCDVGAGALLTGGQGTRWYRAPELLYASRSYGPEVDLWAAGCLLAEVLGLTPLLPGCTDIDQLARMQQALGSIRLADWPEAEALPDWHKISFGPSAGRPLAQLLPDAPHDALDLLQGLLRYRPAARLTAVQALAHPFCQRSARAGEAGDAGLAEFVRRVQAQQVQQLQPQPLACAGADALSW